MKKFFLISALLSTAFLAGCTNTTTVQPGAKPTEPQAVACTMDAKACPDGSYVGRTGPNCEFAACPSEGSQVACTEEAKLCPDGSSVARTGPKCEFAPCPTGNTSATATGGNYSCGITPDPNCEIGK